MVICSSSAPQTPRATATLPARPPYTNLQVFVGSASCMRSVDVWPCVWPLTAAAGRVDECRDVRSGNARRRPRSASLGLALFSSRICRFLGTSHAYAYGHMHPRGKSNPPESAQKSLCGFRAFWLAAIGVCLVYWPVYPT